MRVANFAIPKILRFRMEAIFPAKWMRLGRH